MAVLIPLATICNRGKHSALAGNAGDLAALHLIDELADQLLVRIVRRRLDEDGSFALLGFRCVGCVEGIPGCAKGHQPGGKKCKKAWHVAKFCMGVWAND